MTDVVIARRGWREERSGEGGMVGGKRGCGWVGSGGSVGGSFFLSFENASSQIKKGLPYVSRYRAWKKWMSSGGGRSPFASSLTLGQSLRSLRFLADARSVAQIASLR